MDLFSLFALSFALFILAASPGPGVFATVARALASGFQPALFLIAGIVMGDILYLLFAVFGLYTIAQVLGDLFFVARFFAGAYLVWLGIKIWSSGPSSLKPDATGNEKSFFKNFLGGLFITLSNPKVILFYCGFLPTFVDLSVLNPLDMGAVIGIVTLVIGGVLILYAFLAASARRLFEGETALRRLNRAAGGVMISTGIVMAGGS